MHSWKMEHTRLGGGPIPSEGGDMQSMLNGEAVAELAGEDFRKYVASDAVYHRRIECIVC